MKKKKQSKKSGIKIIANKDNKIYFFEEDKHLNDDTKNYLKLEDNNQKIKELENNIKNLKFIDENTNKNISLTKDIKVSIYENKYTLKKNNIINDALIKKYKAENSNTNITIQIIHTNEDIKKISSIYINDVVFSINNTMSEDKQDIVSKITKKFFYDEKTQKIRVEQKDGSIEDYNNDDLKNLFKNLRNHKFFFGFSDTKEKFLFEHLKSISLFRNYISHDNLIANSNEIISKELNKYIDKNGKDFLENNKFNVSLISKLYKNNKEDELKKYYEYVINSKDKSLGISIKKLVEYSLIKYPPNLDAEKIKKYHTVLKYHLFNIINKNESLKNKYISKLRKSDFEEKEKIYNDLLEELQSKPFNDVEQICSNIDFRNKQKEKIDIKNIILNEHKDNWLPFTLYVYSLTKFLTIKETNELISNLISKLESMNDLIIASKKLGINIKDNLDLTLFIVNFDDLILEINQLRIINSIKKFSAPKHSDSSMDYYKKGLEIFKNSNLNLDELLKEKTKNEILKQKKIKHPIKNFVRNNVVKTKFFNYIIRYADPKKISELLYDNPKLVKFLLSNLSESQLNKFKNDKNLEEIISKITLETINNNLKNGNTEYTKYINLYLTCLYFLIKNLNRINAYYYLAFSFFVRDHQLLFNEDPFKTEDYMKLTNMQNKSIKDIKNINKSIESFNKINKKMFKEYRNEIAHFGIINILSETKFPEDFDFKNYFKIYHYCLQKKILSPNNEYLSKITKDIDKYNKYSKNFLFSINTPLMYNYSRYKNISDENIFMRLYDK